MTGLILTGRDRLPLGGGLDLRLLSALEVLQARREGGRLAADRRERALCDNACLLARALEKSEGHVPVFSDGRAVLAELTAEEIGALAARWDALRRRSGPEPEQPTCQTAAERRPMDGWEREGGNPFFDMSRFLELRGGSGADRLSGGGPEGA